MKAMKEAAAAPESVVPSQNKGLGTVPRGDHGGLD